MLPSSPQQKAGAAGREGKARRKRRKGGVRQRLKKMRKHRSSQLSLPSVLLSNVRSLRSKTDELQASVKYMHEYKNACLLAFTETWLDQNVHDNELFIDGFGTPIRLDRSSSATGKSQGGGVCLYINPKWCNTVHVRDSICTPDIELLTVSLRPYYCPREFPQLFFSLVYIHPRANATRAAEILSSSQHRLDSLSPDAPKFILGDFNRCKLGKTLKAYHQYVTIPTRHDRTLDLCYGTVPEAYKSIALPPLGTADHNTVALVPVYRPVVQRLEKVVKTVKTWTVESIECLKGCFDCTDWQMFYDSTCNLNELVDVVSSYISFCVDTVIPSKQVIVFPNNKPWITKDLKEILNKKKRVFFSGSAEEKKEVNKEVKASVRKARAEYRDRIQVRFASGCLRAAWKGIKTMASINSAVTSDKPLINIEGVFGPQLPDQLNTFFARFERHDFSHNLSEVKQSLFPVDDIVIDERLVNRLLKRININKSPGPDGIDGRTLKFCADQLSGVLQHLFQTSVDQHTVPSLWKLSTVIPIPKRSPPKQFNDLRPVALTSLVMKTLEKIIKSFILSAVEPMLDPLQFAYRVGRGVEDAKLFILDKLYKHLEFRDSHARILFADFSSAFNTMQPHVLAQKLLSRFDLQHDLVLWIIDFLTYRSQQVFVNGMFSERIVTCTGSPQGCVLSPLLYILYTDDCRSPNENSFLVKFADDSAMISLLQGEQEGHGTALDNFVEWCDDSYLDLNVGKTQEMIIDFRRQEYNHDAVLIHDQPVDIVKSYKYLGTVFESTLRWDENTDYVLKKCFQRLHLLRKLRSFHVDAKILKLFYTSFIESMLTFSNICWYYNLNVQQRNSLQKIVNVSSKIVCDDLRCLSNCCDRQILRKAQSVLGQADHILFDEFERLPHGKRFRAQKCKTNRRNNSFVPRAIRLLNESQS